MALEIYRERWSGKIETVTIGDKREISVGGQDTLPFLFEEGQIPHQPVIALEIWDTKPPDWPDNLVIALEDVFSDPVKWAKKALELDIDLICLRLAGSHPENLNRSPEEEADIVKKISEEISLPLIIIGCGDDSKDNLVLPKISEVTKGNQFLIGEAVQDNYKTLTASCLADGHNIIAQSPIDVNIAKQLNILISEMGLPLNRVVINPTVGSLGYGLEYTYSIMERIRLATLSGDRILASPFICFVGQESWKTKEAKAKYAENPDWGRELERGIIWEAATACGLLQAGADILVMRHPEAIKIVKRHIEELMKPETRNQKPEKI